MSKENEHKKYYPFLKNYSVKEYVVGKYTHFHVTVGSAFVLLSVVISYLFFDGIQRIIIVSGMCLFVVYLLMPSFNVPKRINLEAHILQVKYAFSNIRIRKGEDNH